MGRIKVVIKYHLSISCKPYSWIHQVINLVDRHLKTECSIVKNPFSCHSLLLAYEFPIIALVSFITIVNSIFNRQRLLFLSHQHSFFSHSFIDSSIHVPFFSTLEMKWWFCLFFVWYETYIKDVCYQAS